MQVEVNHRPVLILLWWKNHLKGTKVETLQHRNTSYLKADPKAKMCPKLNRGKEYFLTTCSCPGGGKGTRESLAENSFIISSKSDCLAGRNWTRRLTGQKSGVGTFNQPYYHLKQWSSTQSYKAPNPARFSVLPGRHLLSPGIPVYYVGAVVCLVEQKSQMDGLWALSYWVYDLWHKAMPLI